MGKSKWIMSESHIYAVASLCFELINCQQWLHTREMAGYAAFERKHVSGNFLFQLAVGNGPLLSVEKRGATFGWDATQCFVDKTDEGYQVTLQTADHLPCVMQVSNDWRHCLVLSNVSDPHDFAYSLQAFIQLVYVYRASFYQTLLLHASVVVVNDRALLLLGKSGAGKSTHARLWVDMYADCFLLNDDNPVVRKSAEGQWYVYGSPWSGKSQCYIDAQAEISGFLRVKQADYNRVSRASGPHRFSLLYPACSVLYWDAVVRQQTLNILANLTLSSQVGELACRVDAAAVACSRQFCGV